jgi:hypothetical protein
MAEITFDTPEQAEEVKKRALLLAYRASAPMGLGFLHYKPNNAEDEKALLDSVRPGDLHADYVSGRMVKLYIRQKGNTLTVADYAPRSDYQSWAGTYPTYTALIEAARKEG